LCALRLGPGEYELSPERTGGEPDSTFTGRCLFALAVVVLNRERIEQLVASVTVPDVPVPWANPEGFVAAFSFLWPVAERFCADLGVSDRWLVPFIVVFLAASRWIRDGDGIDGLFDGATALLEQAAEARCSMPSRKLLIKVHSWDPTIETRQDFVERANRLWTTAIQNYCLNREREAEAAGLIKVPAKRTGLEPYFWLAGYQTCKWSSTRISDAENRDDHRGVQKHIQKIAREIRLTLRPADKYDPAATPERIREALRVQTQLANMKISPKHIPVALARILPPVFKAGPA
jgi:hypothetical protein